jgi:hypothetical protein
LLFGHTVYPNSLESHRKVTVVVRLLDCGLAPKGYFLLAQRALAAVAALSLRCSGVRVTRLRLPPILPPLTPMRDMMRETAGDTVRLAFLGGAISDSPTECCTIWKAA